MIPLQNALHMRATRTFTDKLGVKRKNGEEWLIKMEDTEAHIPDVYEEVSCLRVVLSYNYYCENNLFIYTHTSLRLSL